MNLTDYQAKYFAHELTRRFPPDSVEKVTVAFAGAQVDLNPHQIDAALFAFKSPLSRGALLADEVGLGKTIEAGLVLSQKWAERKRRILIITPSNLRKQWYQELTEKFFLPCRLLETKSYNAAVKQGALSPFEAPEIIICSYHFAKNKAEDVHSVPWDLVVIDEAHRLRNVYKPSNVIANTLKTALAGKDKLLLTATPLQNSLLELFGLVSFIDEHTFGDLKSFREQFANLSREQVFNTLKTRLKPVCHRTLRRQVMPYIKYTQRLPILEKFTPEEREDRLYNIVSDYLRRDNLQALPSGQRSLMTLVLRKLLASSTFAIAGAMTTMANRLKAKLRRAESADSLEEALDQDYEALAAIADEWDEEEPVERLSEADRKAIEQEITDLDAFTRLATSVEHNAKGLALLKALDIAFSKAVEIGAAQKVVIFTESRRTQDYLLRLLADSAFSEGIVLFNGSNTDECSKRIYADWFEWHKGTDRVTGSRTADMRSALVDYFREQGRILIATEAGAEGINLQFCSLVVNYDLPWNPQRIEQRIGRCHRYGQQHDVVVVNFLNSKNAADIRAFERLLMQLTRHELNGHAEFMTEEGFRLISQPFAGLGDKVPLGLYELPRRSGEAHLYRLSHPLAEAIVARAKSRRLPLAEIRLEYGRHDGKVSILEHFIGQSGWLNAWVHTVESLDQVEDHLIVAAITDHERPLDEKTAARLLSLPGDVVGTIAKPQTNGALQAVLQKRQAVIQKEISERNARFFEAEADKLDGWADDLKIGLEREIKELDRQIKEARRAATAALTLEEKLAGQKQIKSLEAQRNQKRRSLFDAQDEVDRQREKLIATIEGKLNQKTELTQLFEIRWSIQ